MLIETSQHVISCRPACQDAVGVFERLDSTVLVVANGAGGIEDGELAAGAVVTAIREAATSQAGPVDWVQVLRNIDQALGSVQSTACVVEVGADSLCGACVGDSRVGLLVGDAMIFPSDVQAQKPLLGSHVAVPMPFSTSWSGSLLILASHGFWKAMRLEPLLASIHNLAFPVYARTCAEMVPLPSGAVADDVNVICARRPVAKPVTRRISLIEDEQD